MWSPGRLPVVALAATCLLWGCSSASRRADAEEPATERVETARQPADAPVTSTGGNPGTPGAETGGRMDHPRAVELALASTVLLAERTESDCAMVAADAGWTTLGDLVRAVRAGAEEQSSACEPRPEGGWQCEIRFQRSTGGEGVEFLCVLEVTFLASDQVDPSSLRCAFAG